MGPKGHRERTGVLHGSAAGVALYRTAVSGAPSLDLLKGSHCQVQELHVLIVGRDAVLQEHEETTLRAQS